MNSFLLVLFMGFFFCTASKELKGTHGIIVGEWLQVKTVVRNEKSHMAAYNLWTFEENRCKMMVGKSDEYGYKILNNQFEFFPLEGHTYVKWQEVLMFGRFNIDITDSTMILTRKDTLQLFFERRHVSPLVSPMPNE